MSEMSAAEAAIVARFDAAEPAPESWREDGLREALAEALVGKLGGWARDYDDAARNVLALPEIAALRAKAAAADRVRELAASWGSIPAPDESEQGWHAGADHALRGAAVFIRHALDGPPC